MVVDDEDETKEKYQGIYGDKVVIFNKQAYIDRADTISISGERRTPLFARKASSDIALEKGLKYFCIFDDDIDNFLYRFDDAGALRKKDIKHFDDIFEAFLEYMGKAGIDAMAFTNAGGLIGGVKGRFSQGLRRQGAATYILRAGSEYPFKGVFQEDMNMSLLMGATGRLIFEYTGIAFYTCQRGTNAGGLCDAYKARDMFYIRFHSIVCCPWCCKITKNEGLKVNWINTTPMILSEKWKANAE